MNCMVGRRQELVDQRAAALRVVEEGRVAPWDDLEARVGWQGACAMANLWAAVGVLVAPNHEHGHDQLPQLGLREKVLRAGPPDSHGEPHVAKYRRPKAGLVHALVDDLEEPVRRSLGGAGPTTPRISVRRVVATFGERIRAAS